MELIKIENKRIQEIVNLYFTDKFLELNPVISGGFAVSVYHFLKLYDTDNKFENFKRNFYHIKNLSMAANYERLFSFSDLDVWFLNQNLNQRK